MKICKKCNLTYPEQLRFCAKCGMKLEETIDGSIAGIKEKEKEKEKVSNSYDYMIISFFIVAIIIFGVAIKYYGYPSNTYDIKPYHVKMTLPSNFIPITNKEYMKGWMLPDDATAFIRERDGLIVSISSPMTIIHPEVEQLLASDKTNENMMYSNLLKDTIQNVVPEYNIKSLGSCSYFGYFNTNKMYFDAYNYGKYILYDGRLCFRDSSRQFIECMNYRKKYSIVYIYTKDTKPRSRVQIEKKDAEFQKLLSGITDY